MWIQLVLINGNYATMSKFTLLSSFTVKHLEQNTTRVLTFKKRRRREKKEKKKKPSVTLKTISSVTANVLSSFPVRWLISFWRSLVSDKICKQCWMGTLQLINSRHVNLNSEINWFLFKLLIRLDLFTAVHRTLRSYEKSTLLPCAFRCTFVISSFCFLMLLTISKILWVYADRDASWGRFSNSFTYIKKRQKRFQTFSKVPKDMKLCISQLSTTVVKKDQLKCI